MQKSMDTRVKPEDDVEYAERFIITRASYKFQVLQFAARSGTRSNSRNPAPRNRMSVAMPIWAEPLI